MTAPLRERLEDLLTRLDSPADRTLVQAAIRELAEREKDAERYRAVRNGDAGNWKIGRYSGVVMWVLGEHADTAIDAAIKEKL